MKRKSFIGSIIPAVISVNSIAKGVSEDCKDIKIPKYLKIGSTIGITSPAGFITVAELIPAVERLKNWGFNIVVGDTIGRRDFTFGGTDEERAIDFQKMLDDPKIDAILCARGGYGFVRILDKLNFSSFKKNPKWIIGFSDITILHTHLQSELDIASIHSKMCNSFPDDWTKADEIQKQTIESIRDCLLGKKMSYDAPFNSNNKLGNTSGEIVGGNLSCIVNLSGSESEIETKNKILFVEDTSEYLYSIDRMFWNLLRSGKLDHLKGLIVGGFRVKKDDAGDEFGKTIEQIILEKIGDKKYPVCFDFPVGHQKNNFALKCGVKHQLSVIPNGTTLIEIDK